MQKDKLEIIKSVLAESDRIWAAWHKPDVCIAACRVVRNVLREFSIDATPFVTRVICSNAILAAAMDGGLADRLPDAADQMAWMKEAGGYNVGLGYEDTRVKLGLRQREAGKWGAHLALIDTRNGFLIDPTLGQASRPQRGIDLPQSIVFDATPDFVAGAKLTEIQFADGSRAAYQVFPAEAGSWTRSPDWTQRGRLKPQIKTILKGLKK